MKSIKKNILKNNRKLIFSLFLVILIISFLFYCFYPIIFYFQDLKNSPGRIYLKDRNGILITDKSKPGGYKEKYIIYDKNSVLINSIIKIEDKKFFKHSGINILSKFRAIKDNISGRQISGGSTITEQYIKNKYFKNSSRNYLQKLREATLAMFFELKYSKNELLDSYLNNIYFGNKIYGLSAANNIYFNKNILNELTKEEITILISLIHNPGVKSINEKNFQKYFEKIKNRLGFNFEKIIFKLNKKENIDTLPFVTNNLKPDNISGKVSIDYELQKFSKNILNKTLEGLKGKNVTNGAIFAINPRTKEILIYQGSRDFYSDKIDGEVDVLQSNRQPGSTMKPFLYLLALIEGANGDDFLVDLESEYNTSDENKIFMAQNYSLKEFGLVRLKKALGNSLNNSSVRLARELGLENVYDFYKDFGFKLNLPSDHYGYSLVLGNPSIKLKDLVYSYSRLVPENKPHPNPLLIGEGKRLEDNLEVNKFLLYDILSNPDNRDISFGVNSILNTSIPQAVKTGTSSDFRDNLIVSYHPDFVIGIWIGNNDNSSMIGVTGITGAGYIWHQIIEKAIKLGYITNSEIQVPAGVLKKEYCLDEKCYRKEIVYGKNEEINNSRIADSIYFESDIFEELISDERIRLEEKGFLVE